MTDKGYRVLDPHVGVIYGDKISLPTATRTLSDSRRRRFASTNVVFGIGSHTYQRTNRDTFGHAFKSTAVTIDGREKAIFKDPSTDVGHMKRSLRGRIAVTHDGDDLRVIDGLSSSDAISGDLLRVVFRDGATSNIESLAQIRSRLLSYLEV